ncbi:hypothetical protein DSCA_20250 [Desulfosarcina alkanivorans]|uniref:Glycosyltransferase RgtA/B/C/D-like domain-containing protein n=2 Tax=Desulfosarcina alkanivorans TaxID=571177 RepID=A0A5K7YI85_9BACT|nr:hypothetical protein DSCA_20250 [Desulfosarcina alkanivorans]
MPCRNRVEQNYAMGLSRTSSNDSVQSRDLVVIALLAIGYRLLCASVIADHPLFQFPIIDAGYHDGWAKRIVAGDILGHGPDDVFKPALYAYWLAGGYALFGQNIFCIQWVQYSMGILSCILAAILSARLLGRRAGFFSGVLSALYAPYIFFESQLLTPALSIALNLSAMLFLVGSRSRPANTRFLFGGILLGLSAGVRPDVLLPAGLVAVYLSVEGKKRALRGTAGRTVFLAAGIAAVLLPVTIRNYVLTTEIIPVSSNAGINLYSGNHLSADGISAIPVGLKWERLVSRVPQDILEKPGKASQWWIRRALGDMSENYNRALSRMVKKGLAFFNRREFRNNICFHFMQESAWPMRYPFLQFGIILPLSFCGLIGMAKKRDRQVRFAFNLCLLWIVGYLLVGVVFFVNSRFRIPVVPFLMIPAGWALKRLADDVSARDWRSVGYRMAWFLMAGLISWPMWFGKPQHDWVRDYVNLGNAYQFNRQTEDAENAYRNALEVTSDPDAHYLLAKSLFARKQVAQALHHIQAALARMPESPDILMLAAQISLVNHNQQKAGAFLRRLIELSQDSNLWPKRAQWATAHIMLANLEPSEAGSHWKQAWLVDPVTAAEASFLARKDMSRVLQTFQTESESKPWDWYAQANYGMALIETRQVHQALAPLARASELAPQKTGLRFQLARAHHMAGNAREAKAILVELLQVLPKGPMRNHVAALYARLFSN